MTSSWLAHLPDRLGALPVGGDLVRTDAAGPKDARIVLLGVHPSAVEWKHPTVKGQPVKVPVSVERTAFDPQSHSGQELDARYLVPLGLRREDVLLADLWPYFMASTRRESGRPSVAENVRAYEKETGEKTAVVARPPANELLAHARSAPGNLERLREILGGKPRLVLTLGNEPAAFVRGLVRAADAQAYLYGEPVELNVADLDLKATFVHLAHPGNGSPEWKDKHSTWCAERGRELVRATLVATGS